MSKFFYLILLNFSLISFGQTPLFLPPLDGPQKTYTTPAGWENYSGSPDIVIGNGKWDVSGMFDLDKINGDFPGNSMVWMMYVTASEKEGIKTTKRGLEVGKNYSVAIQWQQCVMVLDSVYQYAGGELEMIVQGESTIFTSDGLEDDWQEAKVSFKAKTEVVDIVVLIHIPDQPLESKYGGCIVIDNLIGQEGEIETPEDVIVPETAIRKDNDAQFLNFKNIEFESSKADILSEMYPILEEVYHYLMDHANFRLTLVGHADSQGGLNDNDILSRKRSEAVKDYLIQKGIDSKRLMVQYYGETKSLTSNNTSHGRQRNRRVEFLFIESK
jgi:outer membrane protein OmpA-like peptidoglycan-associated protein